jgi:hypothetical protein
MVLLELCLTWRSNTIVIVVSSGRSKGGRNRLYSPYAICMFFCRCHAYARNPMFQHSS